ncbi:MAG: ribosomal RNA small subunit methyltransferase A [Verrucomicrobia bacterium]|nr:ribosomal RNA small subunit methyltransferase A [Verrucomicrobiota bacterium]
MKVYKPSDLQAFLKEQGLHAKKGLSQNFLIDGNIIQKIIDAASVQAGDFVIEIGPGPGALTQGLLERGAHVLAVEMDAMFSAALLRLQTSDNRLEVVREDILKFPLVETLEKRAGKKAKVVANLPYHITTPILTLLLPLHHLIDSLTIMVQKEFADRMQSKKGTPEYSSFTVFLQFYASVDKSFVVSPNCFYPKPKVHSSVVNCKLHPPLLEKETDRFFQLTRTAFGQRRKMLRSSLKDLYGSEKVEQALLNIGHPITERPEGLSIDEFISLYGLLSVSA